MVVVGCMCPEFVCKLVKKLTGAIEASCKDGLFDDGDNATHWCDINRYTCDILLEAEIDNILFTCLTFL